MYPSRSGIAAPLGRLRLAAGYDPFGSGSVLHSNPRLPAPRYAESRSAPDAVAPEAATGCRATAMTRVPPAGENVTLRRAARSAFADAARRLRRRRISASATR